MPRKLFKQWSPDPGEIKKNPALRFLGHLIHDPNLFHLNRHSVSVAFFVGLFIAFLPIFGQIPLAAVTALYLRCNLPLSVALVWISNPLTFPIIFVACHKVGAHILSRPPRDFNFELSIAWFKSEFLLIWQPLLLGCILASFFFGCVGFLVIQWTWRWHVMHKWKQRGHTRRLRMGKKN